MRDLASVGNTLLKSGPFSTGYLALNQSRIKHIEEDERGEHHSGVASAHNLVHLGSGGVDARIETNETIAVLDNLLITITTGCQPNPSRDSVEHIGGNILKRLKGSKHLQEGLLNTEIRMHNCCVGLSGAFVTHLGLPARAAFYARCRK